MTVNFVGCQIGFVHLCFFCCPSRFTKVYLNELQDADVEYIISSKFPSIERETLRNMIKFNERVIQELSNDRTFARQGSPWEFNLRDIFRWCDLMITDVSDSLNVLSESSDDINTSMVDDEKSSVPVTYVHFVRVVVFLCVSTFYLIDGIHF